MLYTCYVCSKRAYKALEAGAGLVEEAPELPEDAQPGHTIQLQLEDDDEQQQEEEADGGGGLHRHADLYQKSLRCYLEDPVLKNVFMDRWMKMSEEGRMAVRQTWNGGFGRMPPLPLSFLDCVHVCAPAPLSFPLVPSSCSFCVCVSICLCLCLHVFKHA